MRPRRRHGVLLLIVLCVLFMFLLLAITYAVVASKERTVTRNYARYERSGDPPNVMLDEIAMMLFRDTNDTHSPFRSWSLLEDMYGNVSFRGTISQTPAPTPQAGGQFLQFTPTVSNFNTTPNYYKGCVLTMLTGQCAGLSTRIVASTGTSVTVMRFQADAGLYDPAYPDTFLINGRPFCGMGRGYNTTNPANATDPANNAVDPSLASILPPSVQGLYALLPNPVGFAPSATYGSDPGGPGGANMDYTACDNNHCYLGLSLAINTGTQSQTTILPSFFRPDLYSYWETQVPNLKTNPSNQSNAALLRKISFRPNPADHPAFCQNTNPGFTPDSPAISPTTSYDVDNTGGGTPDSIWMDPGLPAITMRDGRTAKVLVAVCELDMDGRINVNAHGSALNLDTNFPATSVQNGVTATSNTSAVLAGVASKGTVSLPPGQGYGPPEINLYSIFSAAEVSNILLGASGGLPGRYNGNASPGNSNSGWTVQNQPLEWVKLFEFPITPLTPLNQAYTVDDPRYLPTTYSNAVYASSFMSPPDLKGRRMLGIDPRGNLNFLTPGGNVASYWQYDLQASRLGSVAESPYAFNLSRSVPRPARYISGYNGIDDPFTVGELEPILRQYDVDVRSLPQRLYSFIPSILTDQTKRNKLTTDSYDLPVPNFQAPRALRSGLSSLGFRAYGITDLLNAKMQQNGCAMVGNSVEIAKLLPPELIAGSRMDINRPFGDGRCNTAGVSVDSPGGILSPNSANTNYVAGPPDANPESLKTLASVPGTSGYSTAVPFNLVNGSSSTTLGADPVLSKNLPAGVQARQLMARQLYALMMLFADQGVYNWTVETGLSATQQQQLTARRIAQWAINAVSFRDATSMMTPFMYHWDIYQSTYQGWTVDGDPGNQSQGGNGNYGIVWACKPPEALLTETIAFHDKRIADTAWDSGNSHKVGDKPADLGGTSGAPNFDQTRIPQGSTFIEIYCTHNGNLPYAPVDLYTNVGTAGAPVWELNLSKMSGDNVNPVWRLAISQSRLSNPNADFLTATSVNSLATHPDTTTFEPTTDPAAAGMPWQKMNLFDATGAQNVPIERIVWLGSTRPSFAPQTTLSPGWIAAPGTQVYYNRTGTVNVAPGSYVVIGPRATTYVGAAGNFTTSTLAKPQWGAPSLQKITVTPTVTATGPNGVSTMPAANVTKLSPYATVGMVCAADPPTTWNSTTALAAQTAAGIGLSVSEPLPAPPTAATPSVYYPEPTVLNPSIAGVYDAYDDLTQTNSTANKYLDQPLEETGSNLTSCPLLKDAISKTGTTPNYRTVFLQRLADPSSGYDALRNPYLTVDWMPIDLTVFNGEELAANANPNDTAAKTPSVNFTSRQRGGSNPSAPNPGTYNIWAPVQASDTLGVPTAAAPAAGTPPANFPFQLSHTLGSLNAEAFGPALTTANDVAPQYVGDPAQPFPSIDWNARPYVSPMELLNVPASAPERLLFEFNSPGTPVAYGVGGITQLPPVGANPYTPGPNGTTPNPNVRAPFGHLLNFMNSALSSYTAGTSPNFYRLFDYVHVPSRFIGCETILNPTYFPYNGTFSANPGTQYFLPPFNMVSNYREPGKMNLNTITDPGVFAGLLNGMTSAPGVLSPTFAQFCDSRRGDGASTGATIAPTSLPTYFGNPFRSAAGSDLVPVSQMMHSGVNVTLLRANTPTPDSGTVPLFGQNASTNAYNNTARNSYFTYQELQRISNLVTTRSNVFGVWLTIGYFEVAPASNGVDAGHPDGYQLGEEIGSDTGEVERHRAFYMFDRSIPVGYERGQNHNVNRAILLKRYIE